MFKSIYKSLLFIYTIFVFSYPVNLRFVKSYQSKLERVEGEKLISVIVPLSSEEDGLPTLLESLKDQSYDNFEVIFISSSNISSSNIVNTLKKFKKSVDFKVKIYTLKDSDKRDDVNDRGVELSKGEIILFTSVDYRFNSNFLEELSSYYVSDEIGGVIVDLYSIGDSTLISKFQKLVSSLMSNLSQMSLVFSSHLAGKKIISYSRKAYHSSLNKGLRDERYKFLALPIHLGFEKSLKSIFYQHIDGIRGTASYYTLLLIFFYLFHLSSIYYLFRGSCIAIFKIFLDILLVVNINYANELNISFLYLLLLGLVYPIYYVILASFSIIPLNIGWK